MRIARLQQLKEAVRLNVSFLRRLSILTFSSRRDFIPSIDDPIGAKENVERESLRFEGLSRARPPEPERMHYQRSCTGVSLTSNIDLSAFSMSSATGSLERMLSASS